MCQYHMWVGVMLLWRLTRKQRQGHRNRFGRPPDQYSANQPTQNCRMSFNWLFNSCSNNALAGNSEDSCRLGGKQTLLPEERPRPSVAVWENYGREDNKESRRSASFSSITAATESLEFGDNGFKQKGGWEQNNFSRGGAAGGGRRGGACPRTLCSWFTLPVHYRFASYGPEREWCMTAALKI